MGWVKARCGSVSWRNRAILLATLNAGSARNPHVLYVRSGYCALSVSKLTATITPIESVKDYSSNRVLSSALATASVSRVNASGEII